MTDNLTLEEKWKVWVHYMVGIVSLNAELYVCTNSRDKDIKVSYHRVKSFDDFCSETDTNMSEGLPGHFWRFKDRIFKDTDKYKVLAKTI